MSQYETTDNTIAGLLMRRTTVGASPFPNSTPSHPTQARERSGRGALRLSSGSLGKAVYQLVHAAELAQRGIQRRRSVERRAIADYHQRRLTRGSLARAVYQLVRAAELAQRCAQWRRDVEHRQRLNADAITRGPMRIEWRGAGIAVIDSKRNQRTMRDARHSRDADFTRGSHHFARPYPTRLGKLDELAFSAHRPKSIVDVAGPPMRALLEAPEAGGKAGIEPVPNRAVEAAYGVLGTALRQHSATWGHGCHSRTGHG